MFAPKADFYKLLFIVSFVSVSCKDASFSTNGKKGASGITGPTIPTVSNPQQSGRLDDKGNQELRDLIGSNPSGPGVPNNLLTTQNFWLSCDPSSGGSSLTTEISGPSGISARINGEFCPQAVAGEGSKFLFIIDYSESMKTNDPIINNSCGRLEAIKALVQKLVQKYGTKVSFGSVAFGSYAQVQSQITDATSFQSSLTVNSICNSSMGTTNYKAAFDTARQLYQNTQGSKIVYFISDGEPTEGGTVADPSSHITVGVQAAQQLRATYSDLILNAVFLNNSQNFNNVIGNIMNNGQSLQYEIMRQVAGSDQQVKMVNQASDLIAALQDLPASGGKINTSTVSIKFISPAPQDNIEVEQIFENPLKPGYYVFSSKPFILRSSAGTAVDNVIMTQVTTETGKVIQSQATISVKQN